jgi:3-oxoacyl-[acyl-carrier protein] reductase
VRSRGWGRIVNVSSIAAADGAPGAGPYAAAKAGLHGLTRSLARELGPAGILANAVMPGPTMTARALTVIPGAQQEALARMTPIGLLLGPEDVAPLIVYLCSALNTAVTGEVIRASGGLRI